MVKTDPKSCAQEEFAEIAKVMEDDQVEDVSHARYSLWSPVLYNDSFGHTSVSIRENNTRSFGSSIASNAFTQNSAL